MATSVEYCIYIQKINVELKDDEIICIIENDICLGKISKIEHIKKNGNYLSIFVYFDYVFWTQKTIEVLTSIYNGNSYKLVLKEGTYWIARQKCINNTNVVQMLANRIYKMEETIETQNSQIEQLREIVEDISNQLQQQKNRVVNVNDRANVATNCKKHTPLFYISDSSTLSDSSSSESLFSLL
jgi:hypothetical protein